MATTTTATPDPSPSDGPRYGWFRLRSELREFYGLSRGAVDNYVRRGLLPAPDAECSTGPLWSDETLRAARRYPDPTLAAVVPIDGTLGRDELDNAHVYICPARSGHHIGWASPSVIGVVESGLAQWHTVRAIARYTGTEAYETSAEDEPTQHYLDAVRARRGHDHEVTVYLLSDTPLASGHVRVSERARTAGLQRGRLLRRDGNKIGAPDGPWLTLPTTPSPTPLPEFALPLQDRAFPEPDADTSGFEWRPTDPPEPTTRRRPNLDRWNRS